MKLLSEPRQLKKITEPKKKFKRVKKEKVEGDNPPKYTLLREGAYDKIKSFIELYKKDPYKARVKFFNGKRDQYRFSRLVLFEWDNGDFEICNFMNTFGISVTNRMYSSQKKMSSISYKKKKFWYFSNGNVLPLTFGHLINFITMHEGITSYGGHSFGAATDKLLTSKIFHFFNERFFWFKTLYEFKYKGAVTFNNVVAKKLHSLKDLYRYVFKTPYNVAKVVEASGMIEMLKNNGKKHGAWQEILKVLENTDHLREDMLSNHLFMDTCKMARTLGKKVNCKWGLTRLKTEHDNWANLITNIILECEDEYELNIRPEYKAFAEFSGFKLLKTNRDMLKEGLLQDHCVGTYIDKVDSGTCAIFHVDGYTLQVGINEKMERVTVMPEVEVFGDGRLCLPQSKMVSVKSFSNLQFRGKHNKSAPEDLLIRVKDMMEQFKDAGGFESNDSEDYKGLNKKRGTTINGVGILGGNDDGDLEF